MGALSAYPFTGREAMKVGRDSARHPLIGQTMTLFYIICFVPAFIITLPAAICNAELLFCGHTANYFTVGSAFDTAQTAVFQSLIEDTFKTGFNTSEHEQSPERVYGLLQCRGDATDEQCYNCSRDTTLTIRESINCGNASGGRLWWDFCYLRYDNFSFFGQLDTLLAWNVYYTDNVSSPEVFNAAIQNLLRNLSAEATNVSNLYASGTTNDSFSRKIYAMVQCTRDISTDNCTTCLAIAINDIEANYYGSSGVRYLMGSCIVNYETYSFLNPLSLAEAPATPPVPDARQSPAPAHKPANTPVAYARPSRSPAQEPANTPVVTASSNSRHSNKIPTILGVVVGGLLLALLVCLFTTRRRLKSAVFRRKYEVVEEGTLVGEDRQIVTFKMETLLLATENFHEDNKVGEGGFGPVYKGTTCDKKEIAVKKLSLNSVQGKQEFMNEVNLVDKIQHRNLVKLLGCCAEGSQRLLVYEYLPNKSLDKILFDPIKRKQLDWHKRYNIIMGVARGLLYLHQDSHLKIIHRDIKASNILLDNKLNPKIADFGLAKLFPEDDSYVSTRVAGTFGYMAPEYAMQGKLTVKADVYSFGVLLLEVVTGRKNTDYNLSPEMQILLGWAWRSYEGGNILQTIDPEIIDTCDVGQASRCIHVGLLCTQAEASLRPLMSTATMMLSSDSATLPNPTKPVFVSYIPQITTPTGSSYGSSHASAASSLTPVAPVSNAYASISDLVPR